MAIYIARVYADLIEKQQKTLEDVPENLKEEVQQILDSRKDG
ncbi:ASCH domain-containing protein [Lachnospiraceae bacterium EP-SM-12S-S03]|nr:ASCH domain-containing protein [Lachnospiraceae bacterium EP-SM-12S-S03]